MALKLKGSTSGFTAIDAPAVAGDNTLVLPANNGSASQFLQTNGSGVLSWATPTFTDTGLVKTVSSSVDITGATTFDMTGIDSNAEEIYLYWSDFYTSGGTAFHFRFGTEESGGTIYTSGYRAHNHYSASTTGHSWDTSLVNFPGAGSSSTSTYEGMMRISKRRDHEYYFQAYTSHTNAGYWWLAQGNFVANAALTRLQWIVAGGTGTIAGGSAQIATFA